MTQSHSIAIERILELSADAQIQRRATSQYSLAFHDLTVAIATYGQTLAALAELQEQEEQLADLGLLGSLQPSAASRHAF